MPDRPIAHFGCERHAARGSFSIILPNSPASRLLELIGADRVLSTVPATTHDFPNGAGAGDGARADPPPTGATHPPVPAPSLSLTPA